jgi:hypothetical protein
MPMWQGMSEGRTEIRRKVKTEEIETMGFDATILYRGPRKSRPSALHNLNHEEQRRRDLEGLTASGYLAQEAEAESARVEQQQVAVRAAEEALQASLRALRSEDRTRVQNSTDDQAIFADPNEPKMFSSQDEADRYNREQIAIFLRSTPEYYPDPQSKNLATIGAYLERNGHGVIVSARKLKQVFERLSSLGLLVERPVVTAPASVRVAPVAAKRAPARPTVWDVNEYPYFQNAGGTATDLISGWDPEGSGERVTLTRRAVEKMDVQAFKYFGRPTVKVKPNWAQVEDHEVIANQFIELGRRISRETE